MKEQFEHHESIFAAQSQTFILESTTHFIYRYLNVVIIWHSIPTPYLD